ncbi:hypothetical protein [Streptomyces sp. MZ04]|uniref:SCO2400 family protein n=1 Tax=Streptomyces sp. MZ04 TaxID=2559236 RepID=UPI00107EB8EA|nr:hypothetical protein [Streptomyces sp. MZ04]TGA96782.1 hypothetical protein E2651_32085 [Streptomyces sp. MZ04]
MDYCHPCHRHLNGALACPGCGTPAEACREYGEAVAEQEAVDGPEGAYDEEAPRVRGRRRKERARKAHRRRRRRILLATAGLALAAGGLSLAELGTEGPSGDSTASAPDGDAGERPSARESAGQDEETAYEDGSTATASATPTASASAADKAARDAKKAEKAAKDGEADKADGGSGSETPAATSAPDGPDTPNTPETTRPAPPPISQKPDPKPVPTPSETCDRFLWWCT